MHFIIVTPYYAPAWSYGGPPKVLHSMATELVKQNHRVTVLTTDVLDENRQSKLTEKLDGIKIYRFKTISNWLAFHLKLFFVPFFGMKIKKYLSTADVVLMSDVRSVLNGQIYGYLRKNNIKFGIFAFGQIPYSGDWKDNIKKIFDWLWVRKMMKNANFHFYQTDHEKKMLHKHFKISNNALIFMPLPVEKTELKVNKNSVRKKYGLRPKDKVLIFVGRFNYLKGIDLLIKYSLPLLAKNKHLKLLLIGRDDGDQDNLMKLANMNKSNQIIWLQNIYGNELLKLINIANCFVFTPRYFEETSTAALQALSQGTPVITTKQADIPFLQEYGAGKVINNNAIDFKKAMSIVNGTSRQSINCRKLVNDVFLTKKVVQRLINAVS